MILSDTEWPSEILNDTKHRAASLRQLTFLLPTLVSFKAFALVFFWDRVQVLVLKLVL